MIKSIKAMILNVVIIILETKFDCVIGTLQGKKK